MSEQVEKDAGEERVLPSVNAKKKRRRGAVAAVLLFVVAVLAIGGTLVYWTANRIKGATKTAPAPKLAEDSGRTRKGKVFGDAPTMPPDLAADKANPGPSDDGAGNRVATSATGSKAPPAPAEMKVPGVSPTGTAAQPSYGSGSQNTAYSQTQQGSPQVMQASMQGSPAKDAKRARYDTGFVVNGGVEPGSTPRAAPAGVTPGDILSDGGRLHELARQSEGKGALSGMLTATNTPMVRAARIKNPSLTVIKGTPVNCVLGTKIVAMQPGLVTCTLIEPLFSADGKVVLAEKGSKLNGEQSGAIKQGQLRLYVLWTELVTPDFVTIPIDSPATDKLGAAGVDGDVDNRWGQRVGGALVLSLLQDAFAYEIAKQSNQNGTANSNTAAMAYQNTTQTGQRMAEKVLDSTVNIPPVLYRNQGDVIGVTIARNLDFSTVYDLQRK